MAFLHNDKEQFSDAINLTAYQTGVMAQAVEKNYYVSLILRKLAQRIPFIVFKGGTSLSKCHGVIKRFSEDIDITIDTEITQGQKQRVKSAIIEIAAELDMVVTNLILPLHHDCGSFVVNGSGYDERKNIRHNR